MALGVVKRRKSQPKKESFGDAKGVAKNTKGQTPGAYQELDALPLSPQGSTNVRASMALPSPPSSGSNEQAVTDHHYLRDPGETIAPHGESGKGTHNTESDEYHTYNYPDLMIVPLNVVDSHSYSRVIPDSRKDDELGEFYHSYHKPDTVLNPDAQRTKADTTASDDYLVPLQPQGSTEPARQGTSDYHSYYYPQTVTGRPTNRKISNVNENQEVCDSVGPVYCQKIEKCVDRR